MVDTLYFTDRFRTLELNLSEWERFTRSVTSVLLGEADLEKMLRDRQRVGEGRDRESESGDEDRVRRFILVDQHARAGDHAGSSAPAAPHRILPVGSEMQHRDRPDRYRRADGDRYVLSDLGREEAQAGALPKQVEKALVEELQGSEAVASPTSVGLRPLSPIRRNHMRFLCRL